jgi:hypothetical protein
MITPQNFNLPQLCRCLPDIAALQKKAKISGDMLTMLCDKLPLPEPVNERTLRSLCKSVLLGLSLKDFPQARIGIDKL